MTSFRASGAALVLGALALLMAGCAAEKPSTPPPAKPAAAAPAPAAEQPQAAASAPGAEQPKAEAPGQPAGGEVTLKAVEPTGKVAVEFRLVHFDYDKYAIRPQDRAAITYDADQIKKIPGVNILIEGHCDERGTTEYNLALGEHRAAAVSKALQAEGVQASALKTISYGKERPVDSGHDEKAWAKNRRSVVKEST